MTDSRGRESERKETRGEGRKSIGFIRLFGSESRSHVPAPEQQQCEGLFTLYSFLLYLCFTYLSFT